LPGDIEFAQELLNPFNCLCGSRDEDVPCSLDEPEIVDGLEEAGFPDSRLLQILLEITEHIDELRAADVLRLVDHIVASFNRCLLLLSSDVLSKPSGDIELFEKFCDLFEHFGGSGKEDRIG